jgi:hypothetical protein
LPPSDASARGVKGPLPPSTGGKAPFTPLPAGQPTPGGLAGTEIPSMRGITSHDDAAWLRAKAVRG